MKPFLFILLALFVQLRAFCADPVVVNELNSIQLDGNFENDTFPIRLVDDTTNVVFQKSEHGLCDLTLCQRACSFLRTIPTPFSRMGTPKKLKGPYSTNDWTVLIMILGNDNVWHVTQRGVIQIDSHRTSPPTLTFYFIGQGISRKEIWGRQMRNIYLKEVQSCLVFKTCMLYKGRLISKFAYSQDAETMFKTSANNVIENDIMSDEFNVEQQ